MLVNADELESLEETLEVLRDKRAMASIAKSMKEIKAGKIIPFENVIAAK